MSGDTARQWATLHAFHHGGVDEVDRFLVESVAPAMAGLDRPDHRHPWFFLRYWDGGPHIRIRVRDLDPECGTALSGALARWLGDNPPRQARTAAEHYAAHGLDATGRAWHDHGDVVRADYEPEWDRYGGPTALDLAENLFAVSSRLALAVLTSMGGDGTRRLGNALSLFAAGLLALRPDPLEASALVRQYMISARWNSDGGATNLADARLAAERNWERNSASLASRVARIVESCCPRPGGFGEAATTAPSSPGPAGRSPAVDPSPAGHRAAIGPVVAWHGTIKSYVEGVRAVADQHGLGRWASEASITLSQLHMLNNRLGTAIADEYQIAWLLSLAFNDYLDRQPGAATFSAPGGGSAGLFHRASGYSQPSMPTRSPRSPQPIPVAAATTETVERLPPPSPADTQTRALAAVLARRRSGTGTFSGTVGPADLSTLLATAVSAQGPHRFAYPAAGALPAIRILVWPARVPDVPAHLYEYRAPDRLVLLRRDPLADELLACSPYTLAQPGAAVQTPQAGDFTDAPLWVFVVADLRSLIGKYGQRGYRFACLQAGHAAQNLLLVAEALGLRARPIGGFFDDALALFLGIDGISQIPLYMMPLASAP